MLVEELSPLHNWWEELAHALSLSLDLEAIRAHSHSGDGLHETLRRWLSTTFPLPHWGHVIHTLREVGEDDVANKLKVKYGELATTVVLLTLLAWVTVVWNLFGWEECNSTQLPCTSSHFTTGDLCKCSQTKQLLPSLLPRPSPSGKKNCCTDGKQLGGLQGMWLASGAHSRYELLMLALCY